MDIFEFCIFYVVSFTALFSLTPLGTFPPRDIIFSFPMTGSPTKGILVKASTWVLPWTGFIAALAGLAIVAIILITLIGDINVLGTGANINTKYLSTIVAGFTISAGLGVTMTQMMPPNMPIIAQFFLVWVWVILLVYSVIMYAGAGSTGN